jgi:hypothetical protein
MIVFIETEKGPQSVIIDRSQDVAALLQAIYDAMIVDAKEQEDVPETMIERILALGAQLMGHPDDAPVPHNYRLRQGTDGRHCGNTTCKDCYENPTPKTPTYLAYYTVDGRETTIIVEPDSGEAVERAFERITGHSRACLDEYTDTELLGTDTQP